MGFCNCSMFWCALLYVPSSFVIISMGKRELVTVGCFVLFCQCFVLFVFMVSRGSCVALPHDATGLSAVCDCGMS